MPLQRELERNKSLKLGSVDPNMRLWIGRLDDPEPCCPEFSLDLVVFGVIPIAWFVDSGLFVDRVAH